MATHEEEGGQETPALWVGLAVSILCGSIYFAFGTGGTFRPFPSAFVHHSLTAQAWLKGRLHVTAEEIERQYMCGALLRAGRVCENSWTDPELREAYGRWKREYLLAIGVSEESIDEEIAGSIRRAYIDWVRIDDRYYAYWPPVPTVLFVPLVAIFGPNISDVVVANGLGAFTVLLVHSMLTRLRRHWPSLTRGGIATLTLLYGLGTCHMYQACAGQVWLITQLCATMFLIAAMALALRSIGPFTEESAESPRFRSDLFLGSGVALGLGFLSRNTIILAFPFFLTLLWIGLRKSPRSGVRFLGWGSAFGLILGIAAMGQLAINHARFGDPLDFGQGRLADEGGNDVFAEEFKTHGRFSLHYLPRNLWYYFLNPAIREFPAYDPTQAGWTFDPMGNSLFLVSPPMVYLFMSGRQRNRWLLFAMLAGALPGTIALMLFHGTGWYQFGQRYLLDVLPFLLVLVGFSMRGRPTGVFVTLTALAVVINSWGTYRFLLEQGW